MSAPAEVPFHVVHGYGLPVEAERGRGWVVTCACGETCTGIGTYGAAQRAHREHLTKAGQLTPAQRRALTVALTMRDGMLPVDTMTRTENVLIDRGLAEPVADPAYPGRVRITGVGVGTLAECRRRNP